MWNTEQRGEQRKWIEERGGTYACCACLQEGAGWMRYLPIRLRDGVLPDRTEDLVSGYRGVCISHDERCDQLVDFSLQEAV